MKKPVIVYCSVTMDARVAIDLDLCGDWSLEELVKESIEQRAKANEVFDGINIRIQDCMPVDEEHGS